MTPFTGYLFHRKQVATVVIAATIAFGGASSASENKDTASIPSSPGEFIKGALSASEVELKAGKLAAQNGQSREVQSLLVEKSGI